MARSFADTITRETSNYGGLVDAAGGLTTIVLAVIGLANIVPSSMAAITTVVFGVAVLVQGGTMLSEYARIIFAPGAEPTSPEQFGGSSLSAVFLVGSAGIVLGILALLGIYPDVLTSIAIMAYGAALVLSSNSVWHLHLLKRAAIRSEATTIEPSLTGSEILASEMASGSAGVQALAGLAAIVLGILAVAGQHTLTLILIALLALGATLVLTGSTLSATVLGLMRPAREM
jgi:hypothetical protein